ncbi:b2.4 [Tranosema rostrale ichnovirus]|nr:b2.4 [Tranosema rostrale ichnovirus]
MLLHHSTVLLDRALQSTLKAPSPTYPTQGTLFGHSLQSKPCIKHTEPIRLDIGFNDCLYLYNSNNKGNPRNIVWETFFLISVHAVVKYHRTKLSMDMAWIFSGLMYVHNGSIECSVPCVAAG